MLHDVMFVAPSLSGGGSERVMLLIANRFVEMGRKVCFILTKSDRVDYEINPEIEIIKNTRNNNPLGQIKFIREQIQKYKSYTVISFFTNQNLFTLIAKVGYKNTLIISERNDPSKTVPNRIMNTIRAVLYRTTDVIVFQTDDAKKYFNRVIQNKSVIIPNPIKDNLPEPFLGEREQRLVAFSRLNKQKNLPLMLDACKIVFTQYPQFRLDIYGTGEEEETLKDYVKMIGIEDNVNFKGFSSNIHEEIIDATAYLSSSDFEGISNSMLEAMAIGLPCICTDCPVGGAGMFINSYENGILVPVGDASLMARAINNVIENKELRNRLSHNAKEIGGILAIDKILKKWLSIMDS
jgi:GalNAc-alpha-(1->4)-GalNAc-alpha-(1->3)-diNAcBac-PP-undecaprenol alpha-1,4-N-acetyl-D-galactosaminyltransferase